MEESGNRRTTHELRISTPSEYRLGLTAGFFRDDQKTDSVAAFEIAATRDDGDGSWPALALVGDGGEGTNAGLEPFDPWVSFVNDYTRRIDQTAVFGHLEFDLADNVTASLGARWYDLDFDFKGATSFSFGCKIGVDGCDSASAGAASTPPAGLPATMSPNGCARSARAPWTRSCRPAAAIAPIRLPLTAAAETPAEARCSTIAQTGSVKRKPCTTISGTARSTSTT